MATITPVSGQQSGTPAAVRPAPVPVVVEGDTLFCIYSGQGGLTAVRRAKNVQDAILRAGKSLGFGSDTLHIEEGPYLTDIMYGEEIVFGITDRDAAWLGIARAELAQQYGAPIAKKIGELKKSYGLLQILKRVGLSILVVVVQILLVRLSFYAFRKLRRQIVRLKQNKLKPIVIRDYEFLNTRRQCIVLLFFSQILKWLVIFLQLMLSVPMLFSIFPQTKAIAVILFSYVSEPVKMIFWSIVKYIPNLFIIVIIYLCIRYTIKGVRYISQEIESGKLKINGFYPDWAQPTFNIIRFLLYAFMVAMIYQYLPGSQSDVFKGISVFVGLIVSLGSTTVIGNIIAGFVITYMRPFKIGDRIKLNATEGNVIEKTPFVTRLRTPKNEIVTIPNAFIMSSHTTNYSASAREYGLIIHTDVGFGYEVPRQQVHRLLIQAARETTGVESHPQPFVLETTLAESYAIYQINACVKEVDRLPAIYSNLNQRIHDLSHEAGLELLLPRYYAQRDGNPPVMPPEYLKEKTKSAE
jgi:small-conductance mechanosensitive channel